LTNRQIGIQGRFNPEIDQSTPKVKSHKWSIRWIFPPATERVQLKDIHNRKTKAIKANYLALQSGWFPEFEPEGG
jgi:hypothetical protein